MKKLSTLLILAMLAPAVSYAQTTTSDCIVQPTCSELGYTQTASTCSGKYIACPFDTSKVLCINAAPKVGDLKYSLYSYNHDGWLRCDGSQYSQTTYKELYNVIGTNFCHKYTSRTDTKYTTNNCTLGKFALPDYRGFFLRGINSHNPKESTVGAPSAYYGYGIYYKGFSGLATSLTTPWLPQYEQLPTILGSFDIADNVLKNTLDSDIFDKATGAFQLSTRGSRNQALTDPTQITPYVVDDKIVFDASRFNKIYDGSHVMPASYATYIFIYAGDPE